VQVRCSSGRGHEAGTRTRLLLLVVLRCFCFGLRDARAGQGVVRGLGGRREGGRVWWRREGEERRSGCRRWWADDVGQPVKAEVDGGGSAKGATEARGDVNDRRTERRTERQAAQAQIGRGSKDSVAWRSTENALLPCCERGPAGSAGGADGLSGLSTTCRLYLYHPSHQPRPQSDIHSSQHGMVRHDRVRSGSTPGV
jgi:hypothetical protein